MKKNKIGEFIVGMLFTPVVWAGCGIVQGSNPALKVEPGDYCTISEPIIYGANTVWAFGPSTLIFTAPDTTISSGGGQPHAMGIGGNIKGEIHSGADVIFNNDATISLSSNGWARGIYMHALDDSGMGNSLTVNGSLIAYLHSSLGGAALELVSEGNVATILGDFTTIHQQSRGDGIRNNGEITIGGNVKIGELNGNSSSKGIYSRESGFLDIDGRTDIYSLESAVDSRDNSVVNFNSEVRLDSIALANIAIQDKAKVNIRHLDYASGPSFLNITGGSLSVKKMGEIQAAENVINYHGGQVNIDGGSSTSNNGLIVAHQGSVVNIDKVGTTGSNTITLNKLSSVSALTDSIINLNNSGTKGTTTAFKKIDELSSAGPLISIGAANSTNNIINLDSITHLNSQGGLLVGAGSGTTTLNITNTSIQDPNSVNDVNVSSGRVDINLNASHTSNSYNSHANGILNLNIGTDSSVTINNNFSLTAINNRGVLALDPKTKSASINSDVNNDSVLIVSTRNTGSQANKVLTINGNYTGSSVASGRDNLLMGVSLANRDLSSSDRLIVNGDTAGFTGVSIDVIGDQSMGTPMTKGVEMIRVTGESKGEFIQNNRVTAGGYEYFLARGNNNAEKNWYLTSMVADQQIDWMSSAMMYTPVVADTVLPKSSLIAVQQPEAGSYASNMQAANTIFNVTLHDRLGETRYIDELTGEERVTSLWLRQVGGHNRSRVGEQLSTKSNRYVAQLGGDLAQWSVEGDDVFHFGVMAGYGNQHSNTVSQITGYRSKGTTRGYNTGLYGTWFANDAQKAGLYFDGWVQYNWFNHTVKGDGLASEEYNSRGISASIETGYALLAGEYITLKNMVNSFWLEPQAQVTWMGVKAKDHKEGNGYWVKSLGDNNVQTRLGMRAYLKGHSAVDEGKNRDFEPFVEANWIHNTKRFGARMGELENHINGTRNIGEIKVGVESKINQRVNLWGNVTQQVGNKGYSDTQGMLGVKYLF
ncbi:autotransporter family porin [Serratia fonticola]|jgi:autotransporter family porin|uniref:Autotransporter family porin n=1 Tax=Serratia fonticola TaxID=47917 RepID=A0A542D341_SERFO|nr:autotransporter outer membrane beta-barrel domain-containing protein [Serratia fonticola]TQI80514.1 autotransporter family porin [Serratia fonticola]TQI97460.1 autotransporter family porin [Serratia fonticola]TVZ71958.1 autotransporter family porin [Serratia fonticola]